MRFYEKAEDPCGWIPRLLPMKNVNIILLSEFPLREPLQVHPPVSWKG